MAVDSVGVSFWYAGVPPASLWYAGVPPAMWYAGVPPAIWYAGVPACEPFGTRASPPAIWYAGVPACDVCWDAAALVGLGSPTSYWP